MLLPKQWLLGLGEEEWRSAAEQSQSGICMCSVSVLLLILLELEARACSAYEGLHIPEVSLCSCWMGFLLQHVLEPTVLYSGSVFRNLF